MWTLLACLHAGLVSGFIWQVDGGGFGFVRFFFLAGDALQFKRTLALTISRDKSILPFYQAIEPSIMAQIFTNSHFILMQQHGYISSPTGPEILRPVLKRRYIPASSRPFGPTHCLVHLNF
jgi:hypothetical protein